MRMVLHKSKQYWLVALKVLVLACTFAYIFHKISSQEKIPWSAFVSEIKGNQIGFIILFITLALINWTFEILKWKTLASKIKNISFTEAIKQTLSSLTVSLPTPNRIGEYGAKAFFYASEKRKEVIFLNFVGNTFQMFVTCFFGIVGLYYFLQNHSLPASSTNVILLCVFLLLICFLGYFFRRKQLIIKGLSVLRMFNYVKRLPSSIKTKVLLFSVFRYVIFGFLFYQLLVFFGANVSFIEALPYIFVMYFLVSIVPSFLLFDVVIRGGVAVWLFSLIGVAELKILSAVFSMWILNFIIPALLGSYFVITYKRNLL
ncbi:flippase-like domain-containing protein [Marixanthomonas sp. SCSIO 43207]|uniref:lysylphosphatidylglycerol synthase domain-containing protein n=1 Tax=Marixanthomonas sp. SCSIO 43207 TaxID=2779360 RepID=UPI001CA8F84E|nr:lysylphosphatidylglycerol synthase domain-containing protein [Marixanthomonas sp. SCSIO 43207]UAB82199.1 flippase-like domain-containing protein [Marixanthomonas sp. SCSIO 43207]